MGAALSNLGGPETDELHLITLLEVALDAFAHPLGDRLNVLLTQAGLLCEFQTKSAFPTFATLASRLCPGNPTRFVARVHNTDRRHYRVLPR